MVMRQCCQVCVVGVMAVWVPGLAAAQETYRLGRSTLEAALNDVTLQYEGARQVFYASGRTLYDNGRPSWGYWAVRGDRYCSQWPPADGWACYDVVQSIDKKKITFISDTGFETEGSIVE